MQTVNASDSKFNQNLMVGNSCWKMRVTVVSPSCTNIQKA